MARRALLFSTARRLNTTNPLLVERLQAETTRRLRLNVTFTSHALVESSPEGLADERCLATGGRAIEIEPRHDASGPGRISLADREAYRTASIHEAPQDHHVYAGPSESTTELL